MEFEWMVLLIALSLATFLQILRQIRCRVWRFIEKSDNFVK